MHLFPAYGVFEVILSYGQMISLFLVLMIFEGVIAAKTESNWPGLVFMFLIVLLGAGMGYAYQDFSFFLYMMIPVVMCLCAFIFSKRSRRKNIERGARYNEEGVIENEEIFDEN